MYVYTSQAGLSIPVLGFQVWNQNMKTYTDTGSTSKPSCCWSIGNHFQVWSDGKGILRGRTYILGLIRGGGSGNGPGLNSGPSPAHVRGGLHLEQNSTMGLPLGDDRVKKYIRSLTK